MSRNRKLTQKHQLSLINFAFTKFIDPDARKKEDDIKGKFVALLRLDAEKVTKPNRENLKLAGVLREHSKICMPYCYPGFEEGKSFERPDGVVVKREEKMVQVNCPGDRVYRIGDFKQLSRFKNGVSRPRQDSACGDERMTDIKLSTPIEWLESSFNLNIRMERSDGEYTGYELELNHHDAEWVSEDTLDALIDFLVAAQERCVSEDQLWRAAIDVILAAPTFDELKKFWPEAALIEGELFPAPLPPVNPVLVINDDTKKMLCANMGARGVESAACKV